MLILRNNFNPHCPNRGAPRNWGRSAKPFFSVIRGLNLSINRIVVEIKYVQSPTRCQFLSDFYLFNSCDASFWIFSLLKLGGWRLLSLTLSSNLTTMCFRAPAKEGESPGGGLLVSRQGARSLSEAGTSGGGGVSNLLCGDYLRAGNLSDRTWPPLGAGRTPWEWSEPSLC